MSTRKRSLRASRLPLRRSARPILEDLEIRLTLSSLPAGPRALAGPFPVTSSGSGSQEAQPNVVVYHAPGSYPAGDTPGPYGILPYDNGNATPAGVGYSPQQIRAAYGVNNIFFGNTQGEGQGMTVAIVDAYDNPDLVNTGSPNFATSDLGVYDSTYGLANPPSFTKVGQTGGAAPAATDPTGGWEVEEALDVEMVHAIAPMANIILVEANSSSNADLFAADTYAATVAPVVSNSWGSGESSGELANDSTFMVPNVTFLFATGDDGANNQFAPTGGGSGDPAFSPDVVAVGGTSLYENPVNTLATESAWSTENLLGGVGKGGGGGGGGGTSVYEPEPSYQEGVQNTGFRTTPDVSSNANPATGVAVYDAYNGGWIQVGGTSEACPTWAAYIAIADQGRAVMGAKPLTGYNQTLPALYSLPYTDFNDVTVGTNQTTSEFDKIFNQGGFGTYSAGYQAKPGYDEVTGLGSPKANLLVSDLAAYGLASKLVATTQPPANVIAGDGFGLTVTVEDQLGNVDSSFSGTVTLSLASGPGGVTFTPVPVTAVNGVAVFDGLKFNTTGSYQFQASATGPGNVDTSTFKVVTNTTPTAGSYYPATSDASLRTAIAAADSSNFASNTIYLQSGAYTLTNSSLGQLVIQDLSSGVASKTITIVGQGPGQTIIEPSTDQGFGSRVFEVIGSPGASVTVVFQDLTITGGYAGNNGGLSGNGASVGGGILIEDGDVNLSDVDLVGNVAQGNVGAVGGKGGRGEPGQVGGAGGDAQGGGLYLAGGQLTLKNTVITGNIAQGGRGGTGGAAGTGLITGGIGGQGGSASGGGVYVLSGTLGGASNDVDSNAAFGGLGGSGGTGGVGNGSRRGGPGGAGGTGGGVSGGGLFVAGGSISLQKTDFDKSWLQAGDGGWGAVAGLTKPFTSNEKTVFAGRTPGLAGAGGNAQGFGVFLQGGALSMTDGGAASEFGSAGSGGVNGSFIYVTVALPSFGAAGTTTAGGIYVSSGKLTIAGLDVTHDKAINAGGIYNAFGGQITGTGIDLTHDTAISGIGGGIENLGILTVGGMIASDKAAIGGGIYNHGKVTLTNASVINNQATAGVGGGIANFSGSVKASHCDISNNTAANKGGGIYSLKGALTITGLTKIDDNLVKATGSGPSFSLGSGGGIDLEGGSASITDITLSGNDARLGGGLYISAGNVSIGGSDNTISDNIARNSGGGIDNNGALTIDNATISGNSAGTNGGGIDNDGTISIDNATRGTISGNSAGADGGGINNDGTISIDHIQISGNTAGLGGGIDNAGPLTMLDGTVSDNVSLGTQSGRTVTLGRGGGILNSSNLSLVDVILTQNTAGAGGGLYTTGGKVNVSGFTVSSNYARTGDGGGIYFHGGSLTFKNGRLVNNHASGTNVNPSYGRGGGLYQAGGKISIAGSTSSASNTVGPGSIVENSAVQGGGIYLAGGSLTLSLAHLANNTASQSGGAIDNAGTLVLADSFVFGNTAGVDGGGIDNASSLSVLTMSYSTLTNNTAGSEGGSIRNLSSATATIATSTISDSSANLGGGFANTGTLTITASTIAFNSATLLGGGVYDDLTGVVNVTNSTIAENTSQAGGGGVYTQGTLKAVNVTIAENLIQGGTGAGLDISGGSAALYNTIVDSNTPSGTDLFGTLAATSSNNLIGVANPGLAPLTNNGGSTLTIALLQGSPAIDKGANTISGVNVPTTDQRGALRGVLGINSGTSVDIGAYEASSSFLITSAADSFTIAGTLRLGLGWAADSTNFNPENLAPSPTANAPNTLVFSTSGTFSTPQTITLTLGTLTVPTNHAVAIDGPGGGLVTISGGGEFQVVNVPTSATATLEGITITDGLGTFGGGVENNGTLSLINTNLEGNSASQVGGGLLSTGTVSITGGTIAGNSAGGGGGLSIVGSLHLTNATITNNSASGNGGGVAFSAGSNHGSLTVTGTTFANNTAGAGAGLYIGSGAATITGGALTGNSASAGSGGAVFEHAGSLAITSTAFTGDTATFGSGGAIEVAGGSLTGINLTLQTNSALSGGAIAIANSGQAIISNSNLTANSSTSSGGGGGVFNDGSLQFSGSTIAQNVALGTGPGGGIENEGTLSVANSTLAGNSAYAGGGLNASGTENLANTTIAGNTTSQVGSGINNITGALTAVNTTIAYNLNTSGGTGSGVEAAGGSATFYNSIIDSNAVALGTDVDGTLSGASSNNLIGSGADSLGGTNGNQVDISSPDLGTLTNNGGPTETIALLTGSPAIDAGANSISGLTVPTTDQRGALRGVMGINAGTRVDIGAYEASSSYLVATAADTTETGTLRTGVGWANVSFNDNPENLSPSPTANAPNTVQISTSQPITLLPSLGTLVLSNTTTATMIDNVGAGLAVISGSGAIGVLQVKAGVTANLTNLEITAGLTTTGGGINNAGSLTLDTSTVSGNSATGSGGGINNTGSLTLSGSTISDNTGKSGGGINNAGNLVLGNSATIAGNSAIGSGGGVLDTGTLTMDSSTITQNTAGSGGGVDVGGTLTVTNSTISDNSATLSGGGVGVTFTGTFTVSNSTISGNSAAGSGGGIDSAGLLTLGHSTTISGNSATGSGGGIDVEAGGTATAVYSTLSGNSAATGGGGIDNNGSLSITISTIQSNTAGSSGGGVGDEVGGTLTLTDSTVSGNQAGGFGGGLSNAGTANLTNATIAVNTGSSAGGIFNTGTLTVVNGTIAENTISSSGIGGGLYAQQGTATLDNTIVAANTSGAGKANNAAGSLTLTSSNNLFGAGGSGGLTTLDNNLINVATPDLGALANNGGPTETVALLAGSPAIDAGSNALAVDPTTGLHLTTDQRGALRGPAGLDAGPTVDIGAYEASSSYLVTTTTDSTDMGTLRAGISGWANVSTNFNPQNLAPSPTANAPNTIVFQTTGIFASPATITLLPSLGPIVMSNSTTAEAIDGTASNGLTISGGGAVGVISVGSGTTAALTGLTISGGSSTSGGAIINQGELLKITNSTITGNSATKGGAIDNSGTLVLTSSTLNNNTASQDGGGIDNESGGFLTATNDTITANAAAEGGGIFNAPTGTLTVVSSTIAFNSSGGRGTGGGLDASAGGSTTLYNTIVAQNTDGTESADDVAGTLSLASAHNLFGTGGSGGLTSANSTGNLFNESSPGLGSLSDNGGVTETIPLLSTSPALNAGSSSLPGTPGVDQRGAIRGALDVAPSTAIDIGAYELSSSYLVTSAADSMVPGTLRAAVAWADINSGTDTISILFDTSANGLFSKPQTITLTLGTLNLTNTTAGAIKIVGPGASMLAISGNGDSGIFAIAPGVTANVSGLTMMDGSAAMSGGAISNAGNLTVTDSALMDNAAVSGSGAGIINTGALTVSSSSFSDDSAAYYGGAIYNNGGTATVSKSTFVGNSTLYGLGGAIDNQGGSLNVTGSTFQGNSSFEGGAIFSRAGTTSITNSTITGNLAYQGGGVFNDGAGTSLGTLTITDSTLASNSAFQGGAISNNFGGTMSIVDSTLANNTATQYGGAIDNVGTSTIISSTIAYNVVVSGGVAGGIDVYAGTTALYDTIVDLNTVGTGTNAASSDIVGSVVAASSYNLIGTGGLTNKVNNNLVGVTNPGLAPSLANNGGPTETIALLAGSPAIGAGSATITGVAVALTDQRGQPLNSPPDIGAYQSSGFIILPLIQTPTPSASPAVAASTNATGLVADATTTPPIVSSHNPFKGRKLSSRGRHSVAATSHASVHHAAAASHASVVHHPVHAVSTSRKTPKVRIAKHR
jgi:fibronectin-binding autotransporter adhesin